MTPAESDLHTKVLNLRKALCPCLMSIGRGVVLGFIVCVLLTACGDSPTESPMIPFCSGPEDLTGDITPPVKIFSPQPQYTEEARLARIQGVVILQTIVDCEGNVTNITVLQGLSHGLTEATVDAISQWRFEPATINGIPISVYYNLTVNFRLQ
jgi:TonB family protein